MNHDVIGHHFKAWDSKVYTVESHDHTGYWVAEVGNQSNRRSISERAIGRTFHHDKKCPCRQPR